MMMIQMIYIILTLLMCVLKKGKENYMHVVEIKWVFSGKFFLCFCFCCFFLFVCLLLVCFVLSFQLVRGKKKFLFFYFVIIFT
jgi:hypothetical protein